ncbi:MAG: heavy-metal-associated domain-containing protein [Gammaproteobacteria bacterium]|nr:heavy-metal-associated domain-containing protein [Gammaproteobacteria bacterium]
MKNSLTKSIVAGLFALLIAQSAWAVTTIYTIRVDGLACPYCAYGIEKKLNELEGVKFIDMNLETGIVTVNTFDVQLNDAQLKQLFQDTGFTYRGKTETTK